jgi:hypothetical protein
VVTLLQDDAAARERVQAVLSSTDPYGQDAILEVLFSRVPPPSRLRHVFPIVATLTVAALAAIPLSPVAGLIALTLATLSIALRVAHGRRILGWMAALRATSGLLGVAGRLGALSIPGLDAESRATARAALRNWSADAMARYGGLMTRRRRRARGVLLLLPVLAVLAVPAIQACGGGSKATPGAADSSTPRDTGTASPDGAGTGVPDIPGPGMATLVGPQAFPVGSALMGIPLTGGCGGGTGPSSVISQVSIILTSEGLPSLLCVDGGFPDGGPGFWIDLELATNQAAMGDQELTQSLAPGTYVVGDEGENDPDLCMLPQGSNAFLQLLTPTGDDAQSISISGTVTIDSISAQSVTGTFSVFMGGPYGYTDASPPPSLSGAYNATAGP